MDVCCEFCVLSGSVLCDGLLSCTEETYECLSVVSFVCSLVEFSPCSEESYGYLTLLSVVCCQVEVCATAD